MDAVAFFLEKLENIYAVIEKTLLNIGLHLFRDHEPSFDAQKVFEILHEAALNSTQASLHSSHILSQRRNMERLALNTA